MIIDDDDFDLVTQWGWFLNSSGYAVRQIRHPVKPKAQATLAAHRFLMDLGFGDRMMVDHINRDKLDNRRSNLRVVPPGANQQNYPLRTGKLSQYRGVSFHRPSGKWMAYGCVDKKIHHLGHYRNEDEAGAVALSWRRENMPYATE